MSLKIEEYKTYKNFRAILLNQDSTPCNKIIVLLFESFATRKKVFFDFMKNKIGSV